MAIRRKGEKVEKAIPPRLASLVEKASTYSVTKDFFKARYEGAKQEIEDYLEMKDCPVEVGVGAGNGLKFPGTGSLSFSQPERVDNVEAVAAIIAALKDGTLQPDVLAEVISTVSREGLEKALPEQAKKLIKTSNKIVVTLRVANEYKAEVGSSLAETVDAAEARGTIAIPVAQPDSFAKTIATSIKDEVAVDA